MEQSTFQNTRLISKVGEYNKGHWTKKVVFTLNFICKIIYLNTQTIKN